jgi:hypothetical protein
MIHICAIPDASGSMVEAIRPLMNYERQLKAQYSRINQLKAQIELIERNIHRSPMIRLQLKSMKQELTALTNKVSV